MLNLDIIRNETKRVKQAAIDKGVSVDIDKLLELDGNRRNLQMKADDLRAERNAHAATMKGGRPSDEQIEKGKKLKEQIAEIEDELNPIEEDFIEMWRKVPNLPSDDTPVGKTEEDNKVLRQWGEKPKLANPLDHQQLGEKLDLIDKERAAKVSGARFAYLKNELVLMQFALLQYCYGFLTNQSKMQEIADKFAESDDLHTALNQAITEKADTTALTALEQKVSANTTAITNVTTSKGIPYDPSVENVYSTDKDLAVKIND